MSDLVEKIVRRDDIRAETPEPLNEQVAYNIGVALAHYFEKETEGIFVGHDMRVSSPGLAQALIWGIASQGLSVWRLGECSTEMISYVSGEKRVPAVMVTASHNPKEYNGFKILRAGALPIGKEALQKIVKEAEQRAAIEVFSEYEGQLYPGVFDGYIDKVLSVSNISLKRYGKRIPVVIDAGNGMGGRIFQKVASHIGWLDPIYYYDEPDGNIPSGIMPDTLNPFYLQRLAQEVTKEKAILGICFDGDADRAAFVYRTTEEEVHPLTPSEVGGLIIKQILEGRGKGSKVLYTLPCSALMPELITKLDGIPVMTPVGYGQVRERMSWPENSDCLFALEHSGHYFYRDFYRADSGMITALIVLDIVVRLTSQAENLDSVIAPWKARFFQSDEINFEFPHSQDVKNCLNELRNQMGKQDVFLIDEYSPGDPIDTATDLMYRGLLLEGPYPGYYWFCFRASANEPTKLRLIAEIILNEEIAEDQRLEAGPKVLANKMEQLINLIGRQYRVE